MDPENSEGKPVSQPSKWAMLAIQNTELYRNHAVEFKLDADKLVRGYLLGIIVSDDRNIFFTLLNDLPSLNADQRLQAGVDLNTRLELEINAAELPQDIRDRLAQVREGIEPLNFGTSAGFQSAYDIWEEARKAIDKEISDKEISSSLELEGDIKYYNDEISKFNELKRKTQSAK